MIIRYDIGSYQKSISVSIWIWTLALFNIHINVRYKQVYILSLTVLHRETLRMKVE